MYFSLKIDQNLQSSLLFFLPALLTMRVYAKIHRMYFREHTLIS